MNKGLAAKRKIRPILILLLILTVVGATGCSLFEDEYVAKGRTIFSRYCMPCHGPEGRGDGYNAPNLDPHPRDLTDGEEEYMVKLDNEEIYEVLQIGGRGVDLAPTMPAWGKVFSEEELWSLVAYIRTLHPYEGEKIVFKNSEEPVFDTKRPKFPKVKKKEFQEMLEKLAPDEDAFQEQVALGEELFDEYGCIGCHRVKGQGGVLGPDLSRAGFMLQTQFIYRWILNPQSFKPYTRMPNLDLTKEDALAVALYLSTLREPPQAERAASPQGGDAAGAEGT